MKITATRSILGFLFLGLAITACDPWGGASGQAASPTVAAAPPRDTYSPIHCIGCHAGKDADEKPTEAYKAYKAENRTEFIRLEEHWIWANKDHHAKAYHNIDPKNSPVAAKMAKAYGIADFGNTEACLACHATAKVGADLNYKEAGVGCESCHGDSKDWIGGHFDTAWRSRPAAEKTKLGLVDLRDPQTRAEKCASCHIGSICEGKFITHEMYAAGHPPLPAFEMLRYMDDEPRHAMRNRDNKFLQALAKKHDSVDLWTHFHYRSEAEESGEIRALAVGAVVTLRETVKLLVDEANAPQKAGKTLDYAHLNCYACHHELKVPSDRQSAGFVNTPGRPVVRPLSHELFEAVARHARKMNPNQPFLAFDAKLQAFQKAFDDPPFGHPEKIVKEGGALIKLCNELLIEVEKIRYNEANAKELLDEIKNVTTQRVAKSKGYLEHDTAQQIAWAVHRIQGELNPAANKPAAPRPKIHDIVLLNLHGEEEKVSNAKPLAQLVELRQKRIGEFSMAEFEKAFLEFCK